MGSREADTGIAAVPDLGTASPVGHLAPPDTVALVARLDDPDDWPRAAAALVAELGFRLVTDQRRETDDGNLLVALRHEPTLRHFDPESISFYEPAGEGGELVTVTRLQPGATSRHVALWGHVHVVDRIPVENRFLTFGGDLRMAGIDDAVTVAYLRSPAPIVRWGGHSQGTDSLAGAIGAFFGRLIVPVDFMPGAAARIDALPPQVLFTAFLRDAVGRGRSAARHGAEPSELDRWISAAWVRARADAPTRELAEDLLVDLGL